MKALSLVLVLTSSVAAQETPRERARSLFEAGNGSYQAGRCRDAAQRFAEAYALDPLPLLLFNEAEAWRCDFATTGSTDSATRAINRYQRYLTAPDFYQKQRAARGAINYLITRLPNGTRLEPIDFTPPPRELTPAEKRRHKLRVIIGSTVGTAAALVLTLGLGIGLGVDTSNPPRLTPRW